MQIDGLYQIDMLSLPHNMKGIGSVELREGSIKGSDVAYQYAGSYTIKDNKISGNVFAEQKQTFVNVFGDTGAINLDFHGNILDDRIELIGIPKEYPAQKLSVSLVRIPV